MANHYEPPDRALGQQVEEWVATLEFICRSPEVRELVQRLGKEHQAFPQTFVKVEEE